MNYLTNPDPLGIGASYRGSRYKQDFEDEGRENAREQGQLVGFGNLGPLPDPMWTGLFQALDEAGVGRARGGGMLPESNVGYQPTFNPAFQASYHPAAEGLQHAAPQAPTMPPSHEQWMAQDPAAQGYWQGQHRRSFAPTEKRNAQSRLTVNGQRGGSGRG